jgi:hypothetical protein
MDIGAAISRAFAITIGHRSLWILGFLASLLAGAGNVLNLPISLPSGALPAGPLPFLGDLEGNPQLLSALVTVLCLLVGLGIAITVVGVIAQGALITGVGQIEDQGVMSLGQAWSAAARRFWALLGLRIVLALPVLGLIVLTIVLFGGSLLPVVLAAARGEQSPDLGSAGASLFLLLCSGCVMICAGGIYSILASALQTFGERAILLEDMGVISGLQRGWEVLRSNLFNIILLALVMLVLGFVVSLITGLILTLIALPTTIAGLFTSLSEEGAQSGSLILIVLVFIIVALIGALISALVTTFTSAVWTLAYRQIADVLRRTQQLVALPSI